jgi:hypothetical protein
MAVNLTGFEYVNWADLDQDMVQSWSFVKTVMNIWVL